MKHLLTTAALAATVMAGAISVGGTSVQAATVTSITPGAVVFRRFRRGAVPRGASTGNEHYLGSGDLGNGANRSETGFSWGTWRL